MTFGLWAQALDNSSPDHMANIDGRQIQPDDNTEREKVVSEVSGIIKGGVYKSEVEGIKLTANDKQFVLEVISSEKDCRERSAPILCYGDYDKKNTGGIEDSIITSLNTFAGKIGRTIPPKCDDLVRTAFTALKEEIKKKKIRNITIATIATIGAAIGATHILKIIKDENENDKKIPTNISEQRNICNDVAEENKNDSKE